ncbi:ankyrin repeat-containing domain protein [Tuber indicum]|nr:ankyrin repeat-containing domain protein [Tuber indicum]
MPFQALPNELVLQISSTLPTSALSNLHKTCKHLYNLLHTPLLRHTLQPHLGLSPLEWASKHSHTEIIEYILSHSPILPPVKTALHHASRNGNASIAKMLLASGAKVDARSYCGWTPLHEAVAAGWTDVIILLLEAGADVNERSGDEFTAAHWAVEEGRGELVGLLEDAGADLGLVNSYGETVLEQAVMLGVEVVRGKRFRGNEGSGADTQGRGC